nr:hypothetical protein [uncultured Tolumonas sp.]
MKTTPKSAQAWRGHEGALKVLGDVFAGSWGRFGWVVESGQKKTAIDGGRGATWVS